MQLAKKDVLHVLLPPCVVIFLLFGSFFGYFLPAFENNLLENKKETLRELTGTGWSILKHYSRLEERGALSRQQAQEQAIEQIRELRYGVDNRDYFWLNDMEAVLLMHPYRRDLEGHDVSDFGDPEGQLLFMSVVKVVKEQGSGYVSYLWQWKDDETKIVPKISHVRGFAKWGWVIGTGVYIDDVWEESFALSRTLVLYCIPLFLIVLLVSFYIVGHGLKITDKYRTAEQDVREHRDQLEKQVSQRTEELEELNKNLQKEVESRKRIQNQMEKDHDFLGTVIESLPFPFYVTDVSNYTILLANSKACDKGQGVGEKCYELTHGSSSPCEGDHHLCPLNEVVATNKPVITEHIHTDKNGDKIFVEVHGYPIFDDGNDNGKVVQMIEFALDITPQKQLEEKLRQASITDALTGLYNRRGFLIMAGKQLKLSGRLNSKSFLLFADLDNMKFINDTYGHEAGDKALIVTAQALTENLREADVIGRLGGDEFAAFLTFQDSSIDNETIFSRIEEYLVKANANNEYPFEIFLSYGIAAVDEQHPLELEELLLKADALMYEMKKKKKQQSVG